MSLCLQDSDSESDGDSDSSTSSSTDSDSSGPLYTLRARPSRTPKEQLENFDELINEAIRVRKDCFCFQLQIQYR